jgi:hypothetical protein
MAHVDAGMKDLLAGWRLKKLDLADWRVRVAFTLHAHNTLARHMQKTDTQ